MVATCVLTGNILKCLLASPPHESQAPCTAFSVWAGTDRGQAYNCSSRIFFISAFSQNAWPSFNYVIQSLFCHFAMKRFATKQPLWHSFGQDTQDLDYIIPQKSSWDAEIFFCLPLCKDQTINAI